MSNQVKWVDYAYPTSPNADRFGFENGCYCVVVANIEGGKPKTISAYATKSEALAVAKAMPQSWSAFWLRFNTAP
jgi:hypothetical protein